MKLDQRFAEYRCYREIGRGIYAVRVELWPPAGVPTIEVFAFATRQEMVAFEHWLDATVAMITGR